MSDIFITTGENINTSLDVGQKKTTAQLDNTEQVVYDEFVENQIEQDPNLGDPADVEAKTLTQSKIEDAIASVMNLTGYDPSLISQYALEYLQSKV